MGATYNFSSASCSISCSNYVPPFPVPNNYHSSQYKLRHCQHISCPSDTRSNTAYIIS